MTERPILFSGPMALAIMAGRKTQTRRVLKVPDADRPGNDIKCPYGIAGDGLWVRETFTRESIGTLYKASAVEDDSDERDGWWQGESWFPGPIKWTPAIFMPRTLSRITLEIADVRVQRLQDISDEDAKAEGVAPFQYDAEGDCWTTRRDVHRAAFEYLWGEINGWQGQPKARAPWQSNPWVWAITFQALTPTRPA